MKKSTFDSTQIPPGQSLITGDGAPLASSDSSESPPLQRPVLAWARDKGVSDFDLAGAIAQAGWPRGSVRDEVSPLEVSERAFDEALQAFRSVKAG